MHGITDNEHEVHDEKIQSPRLYSIKIVDKEQSPVFGSWSSIPTLTNKM